MQYVQKNKTRAHAARAGPSRAMRACTRWLLLATACVGGMLPVRAAGLLPALTGGLQAGARTYERVLLRKHPGAEKANATRVQPRLENLWLF